MGQLEELVKTRTQGYTNAGVAKPTTVNNLAELAKSRGIDTSAPIWQPAPIQPVSQPQITQPSAQVQPQENRNIVQKISDYVSRLLQEAKPRFQEGMEDAGVVGGVLNVFMPYKSEEERKNFQQNMRTYAEQPKGEEILTDIVLQVASNKLEQVASTGAGISGIIAPGSLTDFDRQLLEKNNYLDENGNIKKGKAAVETGKNILDLMIFFPQLYAGIEAIGIASTGGKTISIAGKSFSIGRVATGVVTSGTYNTLYTPNLENILTDPEVAGEAGREFLKGAGIGVLISLPIEYIRAPKAPIKLTGAQEQELKEIYISLAKRYHPDSLVNGSDEAFKNIVKHYDAGDVEWMRKMNNATPEEAEKLLNITLPNKDKFGGLLQAENSSVSPVKPTTPVGTETGIVPVETKEAIKNVQRYIQTPAAKLTDNTIKFLQETRIGVNELPFDAEDKITVFRKGEITPGKPVSFSINQTEGQVPYTLTRDEIILNTNSDSLVDFYNQSFDPEIAPGMVDALKRFNVLESEIIAIPKETAPVTTPEVEDFTTAITKAEETIKSVYSDNREKVEEALGQVWAELEVAEAGQRIFVEDPTSSDPTIIGIKSSFPSWVPEELRSKKLFDRVMEGLVDIENIKYPDKNRSAQRALYDAILDEIDLRAGVDTTEARNAIMETYAKQETVQKTTKAKQLTKDKKPVHEGTTRSQKPSKQPEGVVELTSKQLEEKIENAKKLGKKAFDEGRSAVPGYDKKLMESLQGIPMGEESQKILKAWSNAWQEANIKAPIKPKTKVSSKKPPSSENVLGFNPKNLKNPRSSGAVKEADKIIKRSKIAKTLSEKLNVPIRTGKFNRSALGIYKGFRGSPKVVRIKGRGKSGGLPTIFHEVGHFLDDTIGFSTSINKTEREALMVEYGYTYARRPRLQQQEAFAEFLRFYMTGQRERAKKLAPGFYSSFQHKMGDLPEVSEVIETASKDFQRWLEQPATAKVLSQISVGKQDSGSIYKRINNTLHDLYTASVDDLHPLAEFSKIAKTKLGKLPAEKDPYILARNLRGWVGKAELFLTKGTFKKDYWVVENGKVKMQFTGKSFTDIMKPVEKAGLLDEFRTYMVSQRTIELDKRGIKTGIDPEDAKEALTELHKKHRDLFVTASNDLLKYQDDLLVYLRDSGVLGKEGYNKIKELNKFRIPFYRVMEEVYSGFMGGKKVTGNISSPIKKIRGSEREIVDPLESIVKDTYAMINSAERNRVGIAMANLASENYELGRLFERVDKPLKPTTVQQEEIMKAVLKKFGVPKEMLPVEIQQGLDTLLEDVVLTVFRPTVDRGANMLSVNMGDRQLQFEVDPDLFKAIQGLNNEDVGMIMKIVSMPSKLLRAGATLSPDFTVRNPIRDQLTALTYSNYGFVPGIDLVRGMFELFKEGDVYNLWKAGGGEHSMLVSMDRDYLQKTFKDLMKSKGAKALDYVKNPLELLRALSKISDQATRLGEMKRGLNALAKGKATSPTEVAFSTREVTLDFARIGAKTKALNLLIAFWNSNVQGTDKMIRSFKEHPFRTLFKTLMGITLPSILLYFANRDDERWDEIPQWQKDLFWIVMTEDNIYRIPKPFELGILFGSVPERILEFMDKDDPELIRTLTESIANGATPGFIPTSLLPIIENISNYSFFLDRAIVPQGKEDLPAEAQVGNYTSDTSKIIGKALDYSPAKVDNLIYGYSGGLGSYATGIIDSVLRGTGIVVEPEEPAKSLEDMPIIKAFMIKPPTGSQSESVNRIYSMYEKTGGQLRYVNQLINEGKENEATKIIKENKDIIYAPLLQSAVSTFSDLNKTKQAIRDSTTLSATEKRDKIRKVEDAQLKIAQDVLEQIEKDRKNE